MKDAEWKKEQSRNGDAKKMQPQTQSTMTAVWLVSYFRSRKHRTGESRKLKSVSGFIFGPVYHGDNDGNHFSGFAMKGFHRFFADGAIVA